MDTLQACSIRTCKYAYLAVNVVCLGLTFRLTLKIPYDNCQILFLTNVMLSQFIKEFHYLASDWILYRKK